MCPGYRVGKRRAASEELGQSLGGKSPPGEIDHLRNGRFRWIDFDYFRAGSLGEMHEACRGVDECRSSDHQKDIGGFGGMFGLSPDAGRKILAEPDNAGALDRAT